jgi:predicted nucleic acid-binding protein
MVRKARKPKLQEFILDGSITVAWFFEDESDAYADAVQDSLASARAVVPAIWHLEVANAVLVGERKKRTTAAKISQFLTLLSALPVAVDGQTTSRAWSDTLMLARTYQLSAYDASYLELAQRRGLPLATLDGPLKRAANAVGVAIYEP